jgi:hypothetical protein
MATDQSSTDWGCVLPLFALAALGFWWWNSHTKEATPPPVIATTTTPTVPAGNVATPTVAAPQPPPPPSHRYSFKEGDAYGYIAAVSEEDRKRGKAAGDVLMFRYAGFWDNEFHLEELNANGDIVGVDTCAKPCVAIKSYEGGQIDRVAYNPDSVIGAAFDDAMSGRLKRKAQRPALLLPRPTATEEGPSSPQADASSNSAE